MSKKLSKMLVRRIKRAPTVAIQKKRTRHSCKWCWVATQTRRGWRLALWVGDQRHPVRGLLLVKYDDVVKIVGRGKTVYVLMKGSKMEDFDK